MEEKAINWKKKKWLIIIPVLIAATAGYMLFFSSDDDAVVVHGTSISESGELSESDSDSSDAADSSEEFAEESKEVSQIYVDVGGAVVSPHVVKLDEGARIYEAIEEAGGLLSDAETKYMNMAAVCDDGAKIYVPTSEEISIKEEDGTAGELFEVAETDSASAAGTSSAGSSGKNENRVNINTADSDALQTLDGIGPSMAQRIIDYRSANGKFSSADDLKNVSGIGDKTLAKIINDICV